MTSLSADANAPVHNTINDPAEVGLTEADAQLTKDDIISELATALNKINGNTSAPPLDTNISPATTGNLPTGGLENALNLLNQSIARQDIDIVREMWSCFKGISFTSADDFINKYSLSELYLGLVTDLATMKTSGGRAISKTIIQSLAARNERSISVKLLSAVPGISAKTAAAMLEKNNIVELITMGGLSDLIVGGKRFGVRAETLKRLFNYKNIAK